MLPHYLPRVIEWLDSKLLPTRTFNRYSNNYEEVLHPSDPKNSSALITTEVLLKINGVHRLFVYRGLEAFCPATVVIITYQQCRIGIPNDLYSNLKKAYPNQDIQIWDWDEKRVGKLISESLDIGERYSMRMREVYLKLIEENNLKHLNPYKKKEKG